MTEPQRDPTTAEPAEQDADFAAEHVRPSHAGEQVERPGMEPDEDTPRGLGGLDLDEADPHRVL